MGRFKNNTEKQLRELQNTFLKERAQKEELQIILESYEDNVC